MADDLSYPGLPPNAPESIKARLMAARLLAQSGAQQTGPYSSGAVTALKALSGLMGGLQERSAIQEAQQGQADQRRQLAQLLLSGAPTNFAGAAAPAAGQGVAPVAALSSTAIPGSAPTGPANALPSGGDSARDLAIRTIYGEAGGEPAQGQAGVAAVLKNRLASGQYGNDMSGVILAPKQFSLWNPGDPAGSSARKLDPSSPSYQRIGQIYDGVMSGQIPDPTGGATHYYNPNVASPAWGPKLAQQNDVRIGNHRFVGAGPAGPNSPNTAAADAPAPNAQPVASNTLPPGVTPDMVSSGTLAGGAGGDTLGGPARSPFGAMPTSMAQQPAKPDAGALAALLRAQGGTGQAATPLPATVQPPNPFGAVPASMDQPPAAPPPAPMMADAPPVDDSAAPLTVQGAAAPPSIAPVLAAQDASPLGGGQPDPQALAALLSQNAPTPGAPALAPADAPLPPPGVQSGAQPGNPFGAMPSGMAQAPAPAPPAPPSSLSPSGAAMGGISPGGFDPAAAAALAQQLRSGAQPAAGLSTDQLPGFDNFAADGSLQSTSITKPGDPSAPGFTGTYGQGARDQISGTLPGPDAYAGGPGFPTQPTQPAVPMMAQAGSPVPPSTPASSQAPTLPQTGPMPPPGVQSLAAAQPDPNAPAPNAAPAGPAPASPQLLAAMLSGAQPNGLPGQGGGDPSSAQAFLRQEAQRAQASGTPQASLLGSLLRGQAPAAQSSAGGGAGNPLAGLGGLLGGGGLGGMTGGGNPLASIPILGSLFGGGQQGGQPAGAAPFGAQGQAQASSPGGQGQPSAQAGANGQAVIPSLGMTQAQVMALLSNSYTTPQQAELIMNRLAPQPMKLSAGEGLVGRRPDGSYGELYSQAPKADWDFNAETGRLTNKATGEQRQVGQPQGHFTTNRDGLTTNERTGEVSRAPGTAYRFMTEGEKAAAGIPLDQPMQVGPNGEMHAASGQTINVGADQQTYGQQIAKTLGENHVALMTGVDANRTKLRDLNLMSGALQRLQQNGGTTGMGAEEIGHLQSALNTAGNSLGLGQQFDVSDKEAIGKVARQISGAAAKDIGGARTTNFDMQQMLEANPGLALSPTGNQRMLGIAQQVTQRNIDIGQQMQDAAALAVQQGRKPDPVAMEAIRQNYDQQHHIVDPITGQDLSASAKLPEFQAAAPQAGGAPNTPSGAAPGPNLPTPTATPPVLTPDQARAAPRGTVFMTQDGRRMVR